VIPACCWARLRGPIWDRTSCAMLNDLRVRGRHTSRFDAANRRRPACKRYRYFLGVKWSQVQILSARPKK